MGQTKHGRSALVLVAVLMAGLLACLPSPRAAGGLLPPIGSSTTNTTPRSQEMRLPFGTSSEPWAFSQPPRHSRYRDTCGVNDARDASMDTGRCPGAYWGSPQRGTISWPDGGYSAVSLANLNMNEPGSHYRRFGSAQASQVAGAAGTGSTTIDNLLVNGTPIAIPRDPQSDRGPYLAGNSHQ